MVNQKNKQTFSPPRVGEVSNLAGAECTVNSKVYHSFPKLLSFGLSGSPVGAISRSRLFAYFFSAEIWDTLFCRSEFHSRFLRTKEIAADTYHQVQSLLTLEHRDPRSQRREHSRSRIPVAHP